MSTATVRANGIHPAEQAPPRAMRHHAKVASTNNIRAEEPPQAGCGLTDTPKMMIAGECGGLCAPLLPFRRAGGAPTALIEWRQELRVNPVTFRGSAGWLPKALPAARAPKGHSARPGQLIPSTLVGIRNRRSGCSLVSWRLMTVRDSCGLNSGTDRRDGRTTAALVARRRRVRPHQAAHRNLSDSPSPAASRKPAAGCPILGAKWERKAAGRRVHKRLTCPPKKG
jgi:hypothetical protein